MRRRLLHETECVIPLNVNLINDTYRDYYLDKDGNPQSFTAYGNRTGYIPVKDTQKYVIYCNSSWVPAYIHCYDFDENHVGAVAFVSNKDTEIVPLNGTFYVMFWGLNVAGDAYFKRIA